MVMEELSDQHLLSVLSELETAYDWHEQWYQNVLKTLVARVSAKPADMLAHAHQLCPFGQWYEKTRDSFLGAEPQFIGIRDKHERMHALAAGLLQRVMQELPITLSEWEDYQNAVDDMRRDLHLLRARLARKAQERDPLTGALNRAVLQADLREQEALVQRGIATCALAMLDLDHFKAVNDTFGHAAGDAVLMATVQCLRRVTRPYDRVYRYGGEEFLVCMPGVTSDQARRLAERMRLALAEQRVWIQEAKQEIQVTGSIGVTLHASSRTIEESLRIADKAMYEAKARGRNQVVVAD